MTRNEEITNLANEIMLDIIQDRLPLNNILLKTSKLSLLVDIPTNVKLFSDWANFAEQNLFRISSYNVNMDAAKDPDVSVKSSNASEHVTWGITKNFNERNNIRQNAQQVVGFLAKYRTETYNFALGIHNKWNFGNIAESIFEKKRKRVEPILNNIFPDINQRLNSIERNLNDENDEGWKNAVVSCRTLLMDLADVLNPVNDSTENNKYINRLKDYISPKIKSETKKKLVKTYLEELKSRIEYTSDLTQGAAHKLRPLLNEAEDIVLYTYLVVSELMEAQATETQINKTKGAISKNYQKGKSSRSQ